MRYCWKSGCQSQSPTGSAKGNRAKDAKPTEEDASKPLIYDEFDALRLKQNEGKPLLEFDTLDEALDEFFAKVGPFAKPQIPI